MALHLVKLCVGVESPEALALWRERRAAAGQPPIVHTRQTPRRASEIVGGGSLYWVFRGMILARQGVAAIETLCDGARRRCEIRLDPEIHRTAPTIRRAFQGWRYLDEPDVPRDLDPFLEGDMPPDLASRLRTAGAW